MINPNTESLPRGTVPQYFSNTYFRIKTNKSNAYTEKDNGFVGYKCEISLAKSKSNVVPMIDIEATRVELGKLRDKIEKAADALHLPVLEEELAELKEEMNAPEFWNDLERSTAVNRKVSQIEGKLNHVTSLYTRADDIDAMLMLLEEEPDDDMGDECLNELTQLNNDAEALELETLMRGEFDSCDAILSLHAGAGGTEAQDWTQMLYRMYTRYCERHGYKVTVNDILDGDEAGLKSVTFQVEGPNAYGFLRSERGVHRLVRISPFDSNARRHTSFSSLDVAPIMEDDADFEINMEEVRIDTYRAGGAGGQHVNRTDSAVRMTHIPTGIVAQCQNERSQIQNREVCLRILKSRLLELREREKEAQMADIKGEMKKIEWGSQIRSYVFQPYTMVKDHRTNYESGNVDDVMDGNLDGFITAFLKMQ